MLIGDALAYFSIEKFLETLLLDNFSTLQCINVSVLWQGLTPTNMDDARGFDQVDLATCRDPRD